MKPSTYFSAKNINVIRRKASRQRVDPRHYPEGWSKSKMFPMKVLKAFPSLQIKKGYVIRAYQYISNNNGNGVVWAMPEDAIFPEPDKCQMMEDEFLDCPCPEEAMEDVMQVIEGDGSDLSYISASIFAREIYEFGACWHGCSWTSHTIIDDKSSSDEFSFEDMDSWKWKKDKPNEWRPSVKHIKNRVVVTFYTFSLMGMSGIMRHEDRFTKDSYDYKPKSKMICETGGFCLY